jgi:predicted PurR-regulated permease PerM
MELGFSWSVWNIVPLVGSLVGLSAATVVALADFHSGGWTTLVGVALVFSIMQALDGLVITPRLVGNKVGLGILPTMLALIIGGNAFGFVGIVVAIPVAALLKSLLSDLRREYRTLKIYTGW